MGAQLHAESDERCFECRTLPLGEELARLPAFAKNYAEDALHHHRKHGDAYRRRVGIPSLHLCHPTLISHVLRTNVRNYVKGPDYDVLGPVFGKSVIVSEGDVWARQRRLLAPGFRRKEVVRFLPAINNQLELMFDEWSRVDEIDVHVAMTRLSLRILGESMFRSDFEQLAEVVVDSFEICVTQGIKQMMTMGLLKPWMPTPGNLRAKAAERRMNDSVEQLIANARSSAAPGSCPVGTVDMLSRMIEARDPETGDSMDEQLLFDEAKSLVLAGYETTSIWMMWTLYELARQPRVLARIHEEVDEVLGAGLAGPEDYERLVYTRQVLLETLRVYPPVPGVTRTALADDEVAGVHIRAGESVTIPIYAVHRHPEFWSEPETFDPDRFAPERVDAIEPYSYIPFLLGRRGCLGEHFATFEAVVAVATMLQRFEFERVDDGAIGLQPAVTLRPDRPLIMSVRARS